MTSALGLLLRGRQLDTPRCVWCGEVHPRAELVVHERCQSAELDGYLAAVHGEIHLRKLLREVRDTLDAGRDIPTEMRHRIRQAAHDRRRDGDWPF